jgi:hypothetical protein
LPALDQHLPGGDPRLAPHRFEQPQVVGVHHSEYRKAGTAGRGRFSAIAVPLEGEERDREFSAQADRSPAFGEYQEKTSRVIPVVALMRQP